jgi:arginyl-tRNA synthetase
VLPKKLKDFQVLPESLIKNEQSPDPMADEFAKAIASGLDKALRLKSVSMTKILGLLERPQQEFGDYAFPCFVLAKEFKKSPNSIAQELAQKIKPSKEIERVQAIGPYVNFLVNSRMRSEHTLGAIAKQGDSYGQKPAGKKTIMVEFFHANTHKAVHIGHVRNICIGEALCRTLEASGAKVVRVNYQGDIGPHVAKSLWGMLNLKSKIGKPPRQNLLRWLGKVYAEANQAIEGNEKQEAEAREILLKIYAGDKKLTKLWTDTRRWCLDEFNEMYKDFGVTFSELYFESSMEFPARAIVKELVKQGIAEESDGAIIVNLKKDNLGIFVLVTGDGAALYSAKDIALARKKISKYTLDSSIHVVGQEQNLHFRQLFRTLQLMGGKEKKFADASYHLAYGLVMLPTGKMSSRAGSVVFYDDLRKVLLERATAEVVKRHSTWDKGKKETVSAQIAFAALKFGMVNRDNEKEIVFDLEHAASLEGETGPYVQYTHARICSLLEKHGKRIPNADTSVLKEKEELSIVSILQQFPATVESAAAQYKPMLIARYLLDLSQAYNNFYHAQQILKAPPKVRDARLVLSSAVRQVLKNGLHLLAIEAPERM